MGRTSHVLEEDAVVCREEALHHGGTRRVLREDLIYSMFLAELLSFKFVGDWDLNHNAGMNFIHVRDTSFPNPVHVRELALDIHDTGMN